MKTYLDLLKYATNIQRFTFLFAITSIIASAFGVLNLVLLQPVLSVLFGDMTQPELIAMAVKPANYDPIKWFNYFLADFILNKSKLAGLQFVCFAVALSVFIANVFKYLSLRLLEGFKVNLVENLRNKVFDNVVNLDLGFFNGEKKGNLISRIITDVQEVENSVASSFSAGIKELFLFVGYLVSLFFISVKLSFFALIVIPIIAFFLSTIVKKMRSDAGKGQQRLSNLMSIMDEAFGGIRVIKGFVSERFVSEKFAEENAGYKKSIFAYSARSMAASPFSETIGVLMVAGILLYGGSLVLDGSGPLKASSFITFIAIFSQVVRPAKDITQAISSAQRGIASGERILDMINEKPTIVEAADAKSVSGFSKSIQAKNLFFGYNEDSTVLKNINFEVNKGESLALVGGSGGGKSTLADLLPRFYDPTKGELLLDGKNLKSLKIKDLRQLFGIVNQEAILFNDSIRNNISFGKEVTEEEIIQAAKIANAHEFILEQPNGYDTLIGDRGSKLSGGQKQRISIARAIVQNPPILILDEATSALDTESERLVQDALEKLVQNRTSIVIAHRLSTIQKATKILVLKEGEIVEQGTHKELYALEEGYYKKLVDLQEI